MRKQPLNSTPAERGVEEQDTPRLAGRNTGKTNSPRRNQQGRNMRSAIRLTQKISLPPRQPTRPLKLLHPLRQTLRLPLQPPHPLPGCRA